MKTEEHLYECVECGQTFKATYFELPMYCNVCGAHAMNFSLVKSYPQKPWEIEAAIGAVETEKEYPEIEDKRNEEKKEDVVNHPSHYTKGIETINYIESWEMDYREGNVIKYVTRHKYKNGLEDLKKAEWYLKRLIQEMEEHCE